MRAEVKLETIDAKASNGLTGIAQSLEVLEIVQKDVSTLHTMATMTMTPYSSKSSGTTSDELNRNIIMFAESTSSTSAPMLRRPNGITDELMTTAYIRHQFNSIATIVNKMLIPPALPTTNTASNSVVLFQLAHAVKEQSMDVTRLRHHVVRQVTQVRDLLESKGVHSISVDNGAMALNSLIAGLRQLGMHHECISVGNWAIMLSRRLMLADASSGQPNLAVHLAVCLLNQSVEYHDIGDTTQSLQAVQEAYTITQNLQNHFATEVNFQILYAGVLLQYVEFADNKQSIQMFVEAIQVLEDILNVQAFTQSTLDGKIERVVQPSSSFLDNLFSPVPPIPAIQNYALALQQLADCLCIDGHCESAVGLAHLATALHRETVSIHGHKYKANLAFALMSLVQGKIGELIPAEELIVLAEECAQLLQELIQKNPVYYAQQLVNVLWEKASALEKLNRDTEAITAWEEIARLAGQIIQDSALDSLGDQFRCLKRHDDAAQTVTHTIIDIYLT
ncbi:hypothetical protein D9619_008431 [Psilocybe cf. subviscida]|uniref:Uncharacterized protein n=1 Tax=Psilocybe cf. subviscida TaxID=2480587 RepID=A0A8H5F0R7_9AGAR|nr:hypothetical protein D9619_008431 [Psilocybe cf. subviscida]